MARVSSSLKPFAMRVITVASRVPALKRFHGAHDLGCRAAPLRGGTEGLAIFASWQAGA